MTDPTENESPSENQPEKENHIAETVNEQSQSDAPTAKDKRLIFPAVGQGAMDEKSEKFWAMLGHLLSLTGPPTGGVGYILGPLIPFLMKRGESPFVDEHTKETLNFSILTVVVVWSSALIGFAGGCLWIITAAMALLNIIFCIQGAMAAKNGEAYRYPFNLRIIR